MDFKKLSSKNLLPYFNELAAKRPGIRRIHRYYWDDITRYCNYFIDESSSVLEVGSGTGELLNDLRCGVKKGIDFSPAMIEQASARFPQLDFEVMEAENITLSQKYDVIILSNLIGYLDDVQKVFSEIRKVCHERTRIIVTYFSNTWEPLLYVAEGIGLKVKTPPQNWLTKQDINNLLFLSGFDVYRNSRRMLIPVYIPVISHIFNKYIAKLPLIRGLCINQFSFAKMMSTESSGDVSGKHSVSVVIPARNESGNIENAILRMPALGKHTEIIFIEGNSTDDTWEKIQEVQRKYQDKYDIKIAQQDGKGKGDAVRKGFAMASCDILMILDADLTVPPEDLPKFYDAIASGKGDFINGSRLVYAMDKKAMRFLNMLGNRFFSMLFSWLLEQPFKDTLCGTKVIFRTDYTKLIANRKFFGDFDPFGDFDLIFGAYKLNLKIVETPIRYKERTYGDTNISRFKHGLILLQMCFFAARKIKFT